MDEGLIASALFLKEVKGLKGFLWLTYRKWMVMTIVASSITFCCVKF